MKRRRSHLEMLACALLLAALAVQPAAGDGKGKGNGQGQSEAQAHAQTPARAHGRDSPTAVGAAPPAAQAPAAPSARQDRPAQSARQDQPAAAAKQAKNSARAKQDQPAAAAGQAKPSARAEQAKTAAEQARTSARTRQASPSARAKQARTSARAKQAKTAAAAKARARAGRAGKARGAQNANAADQGPPSGVTTGPPEHANDGGDGNGAGPVDPVPGAAAPEERDPGTPPAAGSPSDDAGATAGEETPARRDAGTGATGARVGPDAGAPASIPGEIPQVGAVAVAPAAAPAPTDTQEPATGSVPRPDSAAGSPAAGTSGAGRAGAPALPARRAAGFNNAVPAPVPATAAVGSALEAPLVIPATEAITRVRPGGPTEFGGPAPAAPDDVVPLQGVADAGASDTSVGEVLVEWARYALALLALLVLALGVYTVLATARARRLERQRARLMEDVGLLQGALLPAVPARLGALLTTVAYRPADGPAAGGDFYDAFPLPDGRVGLLLGDVSGHGRQALAKTTLVRFTVRAHLEAGLSPREALAIAGRSLDGRLSDDFATVIAAIHDPVKGTLTYASAGHPPPIVVGPARHRPVTSSSAPPIGAGFPTGQRQTVLPMPEGVSVMVYSDGLLEARVDGVPLGPERLAEWLEELGPEATAKAVLDRIVEHADRVPDDLAAVLLHAAPGATAPAARIEQLKLDVLDMDGPDLEGFLRGAGVGQADRLIAGRRVSELLARASGVVVEVRTGEHPMVSVAPIGDASGLAPHPGARTT